MSTKTMASKMMKALVDEFDVDEILTLLIDNITYKIKNPKTQFDVDEIPTYQVEKQILVQCRNKIKAVIFETPCNEMRIENHCQN